MHTSKTILIHASGIQQTGAIFITPMNYSLF